MTVHQFNPKNTALDYKPISEMTQEEVREHNRVLTAQLELHLEAERAAEAAMYADRPLAKVLEFRPRRTTP